MEIETFDNGMRAVFPATLENIDSLDDLVTERIEQAGWPVDLFAVRILLRESVLNAVTHGSGCDPCKTVCFELRFDGGTLEMIVRDSGVGFDWQSGDFEGDHALDESGRGLALMKMYSDNMSYNETGCEVRLEKRSQECPSKHTSKL